MRAAATASEVATLIVRNDDPLEHGADFRHQISCDRVSVVEHEGLETE
jgi:hypothetical protein